MSAGAKRTAQSQSGQLTAQVVLFGQDDAGSALRRSGAWGTVTGSIGQVLGRLSPGGRKKAEQELSAAMTRLLNIRLGDLIVAGLRRHPAMAAAGRATVALPGSAEVVELSTHRIASAHRPSVDVVVNGVRLASLPFDVGIDFEVDSAIATVRDGRLVTLDLGRSLVRISLTCAGVTVAAKELPLDPAITADLGAGIPLLDEAPVQGRAVVPPQPSPEPSPA
jgi:hypothetical protein